MTETKTTTTDRSTSPENFQKLYDGFSPSDRSLIDAMMNMAFVLLRSVQQAQSNSHSEKGEAVESWI